MKLQSIFCKIRQAVNVKNVVVKACRSPKKDRQMSFAFNEICIINSNIETRGGKVQPNRKKTNGNKWAENVGKKSWFAIGSFMGAWRKDFYWVHE